MNKKKLPALLMALVMILTLMPMTVFAEEEQAQAPDLVANVQRIAGKQDVDLIALDTDEELDGNLADLRTRKVGKVDIDTIYRFTPSATDNKVEEYGNWICDFRVTFDDDVKKNSAGLYGSYQDYLDIAFLAPVNVPANEPIFLLSAFGLDQHLTYDEVVNTVQIFDCGVFNVGACNAGTKMTVELVVNNRQDDIWYPVASRTYTFGSVSPVETDNGNFVYDDENGTHNIVGASFADQPINEKYTFKKFVVETGDNRTAEVNVEQTSSVNFSEINVSNEVQQTIAAETKVTGVKLSTTDTVDTTQDNVADLSGLQAVINAAIIGGDGITAKDTSDVNNVIDITTTEAVATAISQATAIEVEVNVVVKPETYVITETTKTATFDLTPYATVTATKTENEVVVSETTIENVPVTNEMIDQTQDILVSIYTGFAPKQIIHREDNGGKIIDVFNEGEFTYDATTGVATVVVHHFSEMVASAESGVAEIDGQKYETLAAAFAHVEDGQTIVLLQNIELTERLFVNAGTSPAYAGTNNRYATTTENKIITLDLNNHNIQSTSNIALAGGSLTITGNGEISTSASGLAPIEIRGTGDLANKRTLIIGENVTLTGSEYGLNVFGSNDAQQNNIEVNVNGTVQGMLFVLGNLTNTSNDIDIIVNGTVDASNAVGEEAVHTGIAICGNANVVVNNGATVKGESGIEVRAGSLTVNGGTITATSDAYSYAANNSGTTTKGAAIAVAQHGTKLDTSAELNGGDLHGTKLIGVTDVNNDMSKITVAAAESFKSNSSIPEDYEWVTCESNYTLAKKPVIVLGGSLRKRATNNGYGDVVYTETDLRFGFKVNDSNYSTANSYFTYSINNGSESAHIPATNKADDGTTNLVLMGVPSSRFKTDITVKLYAFDGDGKPIRTVEMTKSVKSVAIALHAGENIAQTWKEYAEQLISINSLDQ